MNNKTDFEKWLQKNVIIIYSVISSIQFRLTANISRDWGRKEQTVYQAEWMKVNSGFFLSPKKERNIIEVVLVLQSCRCGMEITLCSWTDEQCCTYLWQMRNFCYVDFFLLSKMCLTHSESDNHLLSYSMLPLDPCHINNTVQCTMTLGLVFC